MANPNTSFTEITISTLFNRKGEISDNVSDNNALLTYLKKRGKITTLDGGTQIECPLDFTENTTYLRFSGLDPLTVSQDDVLTNAAYSWVNAAVCVIASGEELRKNSGEERLFRLIEARINNAKRTAANNMSVDIYSTGALANQVGGLGAIITSDGTGTVGGINSATYSNWANQFSVVSAVSAGNIVGKMNTLWMSCVRGVDKPNLVVSSHDYYSFFWSSQQELQRYSDADMANTGFKTLKYTGVDALFDSNSNFSTTGKKMYMLNLNFLEFTMHEAAQWTVAEERIPTAQDAVIIPILFMGNLVCSNRSLQGVMVDT